MLFALAAAATVFTGCAHRAQIRPAQVVVACGDGNFYAARLTWQSWTTTDAAARGTAHVNDCKPYCASGHFHAYPIVLRLSRPVTCVEGRREFSRIAWRYPAARPEEGPRAGAESLPCRFLRLRP